MRWGNGRGEQVPVLSDEELAQVRDLGRPYVVEEWRVVADPGPGFPRPYVFTWRSDRVEDAEGQARAFARSAARVRPDRGRPSMVKVTLDHQTVTYGGYSQIEAF